MSNDSFGPLKPEPGERLSGWVEVPGVDPHWQMPAFVVRGAETGPTLAITAGLHAAEYPAIEAVIELCRALDPTGLRGTVIAIPIVTMPSFFERTAYVNPRDGKNVNRVFPGSSEGTDSERVARFITDELLAGADAYIDCHGGDLVEALVPFTLTAATGDERVDGIASGMAEAYDLDFHIEARIDDINGAAYAVALSLGVPAIIAEVGQQGICDRGSVERHLQGLRNVLAQLEMTEGPQARRGVASVCHDYHWVRTDVAATFHPGVRVGEDVVDGQDIGELRDVFGEAIRTVRSPASGVVMFAVTALAVREGDPLFGVAGHP